MSPILLWARMLPYSVVTFLVWMTIFILWFVLGMPLGNCYPPAT